MIKKRTLLSGSLGALLFVPPLPRRIDQAALDAARQWEYTPTTICGTVTPVILQ